MMLQMQHDRKYFQSYSKMKNKLINKGFLTILCSGFTYLFAYVRSAFLKDGVKMRNKLKCRR